MAVLVLGVGFALAGIVFFCAYNWADMGRFFKFSLLLVLIIATVAVALFANVKQIIKQAALFAASVLVGCLFAVYGQVYQTGANIYTLFLGWTIAIVPWVIISVFPPLWMLLLVLMNATMILYSDQVVLSDYSYYAYAIILVINCLCVLLIECLSKGRALIRVKTEWFLAVITSVVIACSVLLLCYFSLSRWIAPSQLPALVTGAAVIGAGFWYGIYRRSLLYIAITIFGVIIIGLCLLLQWGFVDDEVAMICILIIYTLSALSILIYSLIKIKNRWSNEGQ